MTAAALLAECRQRGLTLAAEGDRLLVRPADLADDERVERLQRWKSDLLRLIAARAIGRGGTAPVDPPDDRDSRRPREVAGGSTWPWTRNAWCAYGHPTAWRSIHGPHLVCETCHPPATEAAVAERGVTGTGADDA